MDKSNFLNNVNSTVGIIGFGRLGHSLALALTDRGFPKERVLISDISSEITYQKAIKSGLAECLTDTKDLAGRSSAVFLAVRPQDVLSLSGLPFKPDALVISCMAGLPIELLRKIFDVGVNRMMCSGPDTIFEGCGIATIFPVDAGLSDILEIMGIRVFAVKSEAELDSFTAGICLPAILLNINAAEKEISQTMDEMEKKYPVYAALREWIPEVTPRDSAVEKRAYLDSVSTKGGISEAMTRSLRSGNPLLAAILHGIERGVEITAEITKEAAAGLNAMKLVG